MTVRNYVNCPRLTRQLFFIHFIFSVLFLCSGTTVRAQADQDLPSAAVLKKLSMEDLMEIEVTSVSRRPEKLSEVSSAVQVITQEDIRRSAATSLPEALRLVTNLQVAQLNSHAWLISARGFNSAFPNKLLVMIDGRTVYSPLFAGVFWDAQSVLLEDIERIEVISGPGGTLWGANAVNGVINIITKNTKDTQGVYVSAGAGSFLRDTEAIRYGGKIGQDLSFRVYAQHNHRDPSILPSGEDHIDEWYLGQGGFRMDWEPSTSNSLMAQGNFYMGKQYTTPSASTFDGQNIMARWAHTFSETSHLIVQTYFDRTWRRDIPSTLNDQLFTTDIDLQHRFMLGKWNNIMWGGGYRRMNNHIQHSTIFAGYLPEVRQMDLYSAFAQDEIAVLHDLLKVTIGAKLQHNFYSGFEFQPNARFALTPNTKHTIWGAVSRAVRAPSRIDVDLFIPVIDLPPGIPHVAGGPNFTSEKVIAFELGYRLSPAPNVALSLAAFYNRYDDLYSVEVQDDGYTYQIQNGTKGDSRGLEFSGTYRIIPAWRIRGGYTYFKKHLEGKAGHDLAASNYDPNTLGYDAQDQGLIQSVLDLPANFQFDVTVRYLSPLDDFMPDYFSFDARLAWVYKQWEISVAGQNLWEDQHREAGNIIPRSTYGKISFRM